MRHIKSPPLNPEGATMRLVLAVCEALQEKGQSCERKERSQSCCELRVDSCDVSLHLLARWHSFFPAVVQRLLGCARLAVTR